MKKITLLFLFISIVCAAHAQGTFSIDSVGFTLDYTVTSTNEVAVTACNCTIGQHYINIPSSVLHNGRAYKVTSIEKYVFEGYEGVFIEIPNSVTSISNYAFYRCFEVGIILSRDNPVYEVREKDLILSLVERATGRVVCEIDQALNDYFPEDDDTTAYSYVEKMPEFPGGIPALKKYLADNIIHCPSEHQWEGLVLVEFVVESDGSITHVRVVVGADPPLDEEAVRIVKEMPRWIPGEKDGQKVRVYYNVPIRFSME